MLCERGTNGSASITQSWVVLTNSQSGDLLSFAAQQMGSKPFPEVNRVSWSDAAGSIFPGGYSAWHKVPAWDFTGHWIRNDVVELSIVDEATKKNVFQQALEYTLVFEEKPGTNRLAHGYALALGKMKIFVQHTSAKAITPDLAHEIASGLIWIHCKQEAARNPNGKVHEQSAKPESTR